MTYMDEIEQVHNDLATLTDTMEGIAQKIDDLGDKMKSNEPAIADIAKTLFMFKETYKKLDTHRKRVYAFNDMIDKFLLPSALERSDMDMIRVPEIARSFSKRVNTSASIIDKEGGFKWLRDHGHGELIMETVNSGTLAAFSKSLLADEGLELPDDLFRVSTYSSIGIAKYTPK